MRRRRNCWRGPAGAAIVRSVEGSRRPGCSRALAPAGEALALQGLTAETVVVRGHWHMLGSLYGLSQDLVDTRSTKPCVSFGEGAGDIDAHIDTVPISGELLAHEGHTRTRGRRVRMHGARPVGANYS